MLVLDGPNLDISLLFSEYINRINNFVYSSSSSSLYDDYYEDSYDEDINYDYYDDYSLNSDDSDDYFYDNEVCIYYYHDINDYNNRIKFDNYNDFDEFLTDEGIHITRYEIRKIMNRSISHCCIDTCSIGLSDELWLISDCSYSGLCWSVSSDNYYNDNIDELPF